MFVLELVKFRNTYRAFVFDWDPVCDGLLPELADMAEGSLEDLQVWFNTNWRDCWRVLVNGVPTQPDSLSVWEAAEATL